MEGCMNLEEEIRKTIEAPAHPNALKPLDLTPCHMYPEHDMWKCDHTDCRVERMEVRQKEIIETMKRTEDLVQKFIAAVKPALDDVIPMIASLAENPMISMLFSKKKKERT
jgi:hypothetical protein